MTKEECDELLEVARSLLEAEALLEWIKNYEPDDDYQLLGRDSSLQVGLEEGE
jgi:hypothetical protein